MVLYSLPSFPSLGEKFPFSSTWSEQELVESMVAGDKYAWIEFHTRYSRLICRCITMVMGRFSGVVSGEDVREIFATLALQLLSNDMQKLRTFDPNRGNRFSTWIGMLAIHASYDHLRTMRREPLRATLAEAEAMPCYHTNPFDEVERREREQILADMLESFSAKDRMFVALYFDQGLDADEVARRMNISVKTVYSKKNKIRNRLERMLQSDAMAA